MLPTLREIRLLSSRLFVAPGLRRGVGESFLRIEPGAKRAFLLTDRNCRRPAREVERSLKQVGLQVFPCIIPPGEAQKKVASAAKIYDRLARLRLDRRSVFVAVGGGVITDLGGFVASTWMRGIPLVLVPTTLLGQVDAAIGGKTAVNLPQGKNLVGTFYQPRAVYMDPEVLATLPERAYVGGLAEVVKYGMIRDAGFFAFLEGSTDAVLARDPATLEEVVARCAGIKASVVEEDEKESGLRAILNYGHTIGHALEAAGDYSRLQHGEAVAVGMEAEAFLSMKLGIAPIEVLAAQNRLLHRYGLPTRVKKLPRSKLLPALRLDKKGVEGRLRFVLPESVGRVRFPVEVPAELIEAALRAVTA